MNKAAQVTFSFWILKILATTLGETGGDLLSMTLGLGYLATTLLLAGLLGLALWSQLRAPQFQPLRYWTVILCTSMAGTTGSDFIDRSLGLGYATGTLLIASVLAVVLLAWHRREGSLSVERISPGRTELFYWAAILASNTLGTALGDYLADDSGLGYAGSAGLIAVFLCLLYLLSRLQPAGKVAVFWIAFVLTRPFGATFGDLLTKPFEKGGFDLGTAGASAVLAGLLVAMLVLTCYRPDGGGFKRQAG